MRTYNKKWKPSKTQIKAFISEMKDIEEYCRENDISRSTTSDSYYFTINGQKYRVSNHSVESSSWHNGRLEDTIYIHASKTRIIDIHKNLLQGYKLDGFGNII